MLQAIHSRPRSQRRQHRQKKREASRCPGRPVLTLVLLLAAAGQSAAGVRCSHPQLAPSVGGGSLRSGRQACFLGLSSGEKQPPALPEPLSLGDRVRELGERIRRGGVGGLLEKGKGGGRSGKAMAAAQATTSEGRPKDRSGGRNSFIAGGLAGSISSTITCPIEVIACVLCLVRGTSVPVKTRKTRVHLNL